MHVPNPLEVIGTLATLLGAVAAILYLREIYPEFRNRRETSKMDRRIEKAQRKLSDEQDTAIRGLNHELLQPFLAWYYSVGLWKWNGETFPAVAFPVEPASKLGEDESILEPWDSSAARAVTEKDLVFVDRELVQLRKESGRQIDNRQTFCLDRINFQDGRPAIRGNLIGYYEDAISTCDALERELLLAFARKPPSEASGRAFKRFSKANLPGRERLRQLCQRHGTPAYLTGMGRSAALAVSTLTLAKRMDGSYVTFLGHRSGKTAGQMLESQSRMLHVAPSGMFQPISDWQAPGPSMNSEFYGQEWNLQTHILREVAEEFFNIDVDGMIGRSRTELPAAIFSVSEIKFLKGFLDSNAAELFVTGAMVNLLNLRPEIATILIINDPMWYEQHARGASGLKPFQRNWEFVDRGTAMQEELPDFWHKLIRTADGRMIIDEFLSDLGDVRKLVLPGAVAMKLGLDFAQKYFRPGMRS